MRIKSRERPPWFVVVTLLLATVTSLWAAPVAIPPPSTTEGYLARLLINEVPFPGERGYRSEEDTKAAMDQLLMVLDRRLHKVPAPYKQQEIASVEADDVMDVITAGGVKGQFDGFYRDQKGKPVMVPRIEARINNLVKIAGQGEPGKFARLLNYAVDISASYLKKNVEVKDRHSTVQKAQGVPATGGGYSWMTDENRYHPGGNFLRIEDKDQGALGGNRFYTLRENPK